MKSITKLAVAALLALVSTGMASAATTVIYMTGSTAYRVSCVTAEAYFLNSLGGTGGVTAEEFVTGKSLTSANQSLVYGPVVSGNEIVFSNNFTGSIAGVQTVSAGVPSAGFPVYSTYATTAQPVTFNGITSAVTGGVNGGTATVSSQTPSIALADSTTTTVNKILVGFHKSAVTNITQQTLGIVPFKFIASVGSPSGVTNMTTEAFNQMWSGAGNLPAAYFSGNPSDQTNYMYSLGRDIDSGTRAGAFIETGFGVTTLPAQWAPFDNATDASNDTDTTTIIGNSSTATAINALNYYPEETVDGIDPGSESGTQGYASGGNLATAMKATNNLGGNVFFITYLGISDAATALGGGAIEMSYNGVYFSKNNVEQGSYTFWNYEHACYLSSDTGTLAYIASSLISQLNSGIDEISSGGPTSTNMSVQRTQDGGAISIKYSPSYPY